MLTLHPTKQGIRFVQLQLLNSMMNEGTSQQAGLSFV